MPQRQKYYKKLGFEFWVLGMDNWSRDLSRTYIEKNINRWEHRGLLFTITDCFAFEGIDSF